MHSDIRLSASRLIRDSFVYLKMPDALISMFDLITASFESVESSQKQEFSFESETDGFLPFGLEYVDSPARPDLCERFCYWQARHQVHQKFSVAGTEFYNAVSAYELAINTLAQDLLDAICQNLGGSAQAAVRNNSYLQFCVYKPDYRRTYREYLQDPHEDGHLLSFIKPTLPGLILLPPSGPIPAMPAPDQIVVLAGSLLEALTDGEVRAMHHAVRNPDAPVLRKSLLYFVNPNLAVPSRSLIEHNLIDLVGLVESHHTSFGNSRPRKSHLTK